MLNIDFLGKPSDWVIAVVTTVFGALLPPAASYISSSIKVNRRADLKGDWLSLSETGETKDIVLDTITIGGRRSRFYMRNRKKVGGFDYEAVCSVQDRSMLVGPWRSLRPGATAQGQVLLQITSQGTSMYGVYSGLHSDGRHMLLGWALGRDEPSLKYAVETLQANADLRLKLA